ncbi:MAG: amidohydrolase family protein [Alphaproteobacteria bacterium]
MSTIEAFDLVIRNGRIVDGGGGAPFVADVAIRGDRIVTVGTVEGRGREEIDAAGCLVTPGFVDVHTHYDGQAIWSSRLLPSSAHGVTTVVLGNCGLGFAPCKPGDRDLLVCLMEGVEDIPEAVLTDGLTWEWESFAEYLDALEARPHDIDIAAYLPHSPLRVYVMGERGARREPATAEDLVRMAAVTREAMRAGAMGFATSSIVNHRDGKGELIPSYSATEAELDAIAHAVGEAGHGVFQIVPTLYADEAQAHEIMAMMERLSRAARVPVSFTFAQTNNAPGRWRDILAGVDRANGGGAELKPQIHPKPIGIILGHNISLTPFSSCPSYQAVSKLPLDRKIAELRKPDTRARILAEATTTEVPPLLAASRDFANLFKMSDPPNYEPPQESCLLIQAERSGVTPDELAYDFLLEDNGNALIFLAASNYAHHNLDFVLDLARHSDVIVALGDGGAHYGLICDASYPTFMLTHWTRDRAGEKMPVEQAIRMLAGKPAELMGFDDRGRLAEGYKANVNVIDYDGLRLNRPEVLFDLPGGGRRLHQTASGYRATIVNGEIIVRDDAPTGKLPGRLVRSARRV